MSEEPLATAVLVALYQMSNGEKIHNNNRYPGEVELPPDVLPPVAESELGETVPPEIELVDVETIADCENEVEVGGGGVEAVT